MYGVNAFIMPQPSSEEAGVSPVANPKFVILIGTNTDPKLRKCWKHRKLLSLRETFIPGRVSPFLIVLRC